MYLRGEELELLLLLLSKTNTSSSCSFRRTVFASTSWTHTDEIQCVDEIDHK